MFKTGERVRNAARNVVGKVIEVDGDTVYIEQDNGAEVDFPAAALVAESAFQARHDKTALAAAGADGASKANDAAYAAVLANVYPAVIDMARQYHAAQPRVPGVAPKGWEELSALQKLTAVSAATGVPVKAWLDANQPGARTPIGKLQISVLAAGARR